jgi:hypothetical protein
MKKILLISLLLVVVSASSSFARVPFTPIYWIKGRVVDAPGLSANGRKIYFENARAWDIIGTSGLSRKANQFLINAGQAGVPLEAGKRYRVFTESMAGYGVGPVEVELTGFGVQDMGQLALETGRGISDIRAFLAEAEPKPELRIWFGNRLYQPELVKKGMEFNIPKKPKIKMEVSMAEGYSLASEVSAYTLSVDGKNYSFTERKIENNKAVIQMTFPDTLAPGKYEFTFQAMSSGAKAASSTAVEVASVTVSGGPLKVLDTPLCYPSPFNPEKDRIVTIQYTLSDDANIDIFILDIAAKVIKKISINEGQDGGAGQLNKVKWNGITDQGAVAANGVYLGNIVSRDENRVLGKFKLTVYR